MKWYESTIPSNNNNQEEQIILNENNGTIKKDGTITIDDENNRDYIYMKTQPMTTIFPKTIPKQILQM